MALGCDSPETKTTFPLSCPRAVRTSTCGAIAAAPATAAPFTKLRRSSAMSSSSRGVWDSQRARLERGAIDLIGPGQGQLGDEEHAPRVLVGRPVRQCPFLPRLLGKPRARPRPHAFDVAL